MSIESRSAAVKLEAVTKKFGAVAAVDTVDLLVDRKSVV